MHNRLPRRTVRAAEPSPKAEPANPVYHSAESAKPSVRKSLRSFVGKPAQDSIFTLRCSSPSPLYEDEIRSVEGLTGCT